MPELKSFDRVAHCYDETRGMPPAVTGQIADAITDALGETAGHPRLLEVGIGTGRMAVPLAERGVNVTGLDIAPRMLAILRGKRRDIGAVLAESSRPPFRQAAFDAALFVHILHLVPDAESTVRATVPLVHARGWVIRGQEERPDGALDQILGDILQRTARETLGIELQGEAHHARTNATFERVLADGGWALRRDVVARWERPTTARQVLDGLRRRENSGSWQIPEAGMPVLLAELEGRVVTVFGGLDEVRPAEREFILTIGRRKPS